MPVEAGRGGGSAGAAAGLRRLARLNGLGLDDERGLDVALATGADVPGGLNAHAWDMTGVGAGRKRHVEQPFVVGRKPVQPGQ